MSNEAITWAFKQELPMTLKFVLVALADYADDDHMCYPAHSKTAKRIGASVDTVKRATKRLQQKGYIEVMPWKRQNGSTTANRYLLKVGVQSAPPPQSAPPVQIDTHPRYVVAGEAPGTGAPPMNPQLNPQTNPHSADAPKDDRFDEFWAVYPRRINKKMARTRWAAAIKREDPAVIIQAAEVYAQDCTATKRENKFIKYPEGWLSGDMWEDYRSAPTTGRKVATSWADAL